MNYQSSKLEQEKFLAKKKAEILARKNASKGTVSPSSSTTSSTNSKSNSSSTAPSPQLPFANDGSFLEKFMAMQKAQQQKRETKPEPSKSGSSINKREEITATGFSSGTKTTSQLKKPAAIFLKDEEEQSADGQNYSSSDYELAQQLAEKVAKEGPEAEAFARIQYVDDARYRFLFDRTNPVADYYQKQLKTQKESVKNEPAAVKNEPSTGTKRRWDDSNLQLDQQKQEVVGPSSSTQENKSTTINPLSEFEKAKALMRAKATAMLGSVNPQAAISEEEAKKQKAIEEQKMMNEIYKKVIAQQTESLSKKKKKDPNKPQYQYDSDEDTDGGTWEHKKRVEEMEKTKQWAMDLTEGGKGKHHIADFLPPDELEKFMEKVKAVREGREADFSDYSKYRIQSDNLGYKMLQKAGWQEGEGLGAKGEGIQNPINKGKVSFDQSGVGSEKVSEVKKEDDDFDLYRKRMMLAYKFRPNPLNNPRRPYYE